MVMVLLLLCGGTVLLHGGGAGWVGELLEEAYGNSPQLRAGEARLEGVREEVPQVGALPDPQLVYGNYVQRMETRQLFRVEQMVPGWGKRSQRERLARQMGETERWRLAETRAGVRRDVLVALADWWLVGRAVETMESNLTLWESTEEVIVRRIRAGEASQTDLLQVQMEMDLLKMELAGWREREGPARTRIDALLGRDPGVPLEAGEEWPEGLFAPLPENLPDGWEANPGLQVQQQLVGEAEEARRLAGMATRPDFMIGVEYMDNRGMAKDEVMVMIGVDLPIWRDRTRALERQALAGQRAAEAGLDGARRDLQAKLEAAFAEARDTQRRLTTYTEGLLPRSEQILRVAESEYATGRVDFVQWLEAQRSHRSLLLARDREQSNQIKAMAGWEYLAGPWPQEP